MQASGPDPSISKVPPPSSPSYSKVKKGDEKGKEKIEVEQMVEETGKKPQHKSNKPLPPSQTASPEIGGVNKQQFLREIKEKALEKKVAHLRKEQAKTKETGAGAFRFQQIGASQNFVQRAAPPEYFPLEQMQKFHETDVSWTDIEDEIRQSCAEREMDALATASFVNALRTDLEPIYKSEGPPRERLEKIIKYIDDFMGELKSKEDLELKGTLELLKGKLNTIADTAPILIMDNVPTLHRKDELVSVLRLWSTLASSKDAGEKEHLHIDATPDQINAAIKRVLDLPDEYIDQKAVLSALTSPSSEPEEKGLSEKTSERLLGRVESYCSSYDILDQNQNHPSVQQVLRLVSLDAISRGYTEYAIKYGGENVRELLAQKMLSSMGLEKVFVFKAPLSKDEKLIAGEWLTEGKGFTSEILNPLIQNKRNLIFELQRGDPSPEKIATYAKNVQKAEEKLLQHFNIDPSNKEKVAAFNSAVQQHALVDIVFGSFDSHRDQYKVQDGIPMCFDFARFLAPCSFHTEKTVNFENLDHDIVSTYFDFRSFFLDMPASDKPLDPTLISLIKSWDVEKLEKNFRDAGLVGDPEKFKNAIDRLELLYSYKLKFQKLGYLAIGKNTDPQIQQSYNELVINLVDNFDMDFEQVYEAARKKAEEKFFDDSTKEEKEYLIQQQTKAEIEHFILHAIATQKRNNLALYNQIHPDALENFKQRATALKEYVDTPDPTPLGAFAAAYPEGWKFLKEFRRFNTSPACEIFVEIVKGDAQLRSLNRVVDELQGKVISKSEAGKLREEIQNLNTTQAKPYSYLSVAMGSGF